MIFLREAVLEDMDLLYEWANDPDVRANSFSSEIIQYENHVQWFKNVLAAKEIKQFILIDGETAVGQIRINICQNDAEIGYSISPAYRGMGYGRKLLSLLLEKIREEYPMIHTVTAKVKSNNIASKKLLESEDYTINYVCYSKKLNSGVYFID